MNHKIKIEKRDYYKTLFSLAVPVAIQNLITSSLNLADTVMIGQLGTQEVAAVGLANRIFFILILLLFAISSGTAIFTAQFWGKKDRENIGRVMGIALVLGIVVSLLFTIITIAIPETIMRIFTPDKDVVIIGCIYLKVVAYSYALTAVSMIYSFVLRSTGQVKLPMYASAGALGLNTFLNYCLILGHFGFPMLGVKGAAIATVIARIIEAGLIILITYLKKYPAVKLNHLLSITPVLIKKYFITTTPVIANEFFWVMGMTTYAVVYARMGTAEIASVNIVQPVENIAFGFFLGLSSAASIMIGNQIGADNKEAAYTYAIRFSILGLIGALLGGGIIFISAPYIVSVFKVSQIVQDYAVKMIFIFGIGLWIRIFNLVSIVGILRGGGDTKFSLFLEMAGIWAIGVPLAVMGGLIWKFQVHWVFALVHVEEIFKMIVGIYRIYSKKWIHNLITKV